MAGERMLFYFFFFFFFLMNNGVISDNVTQSALWKASSKLTMFVDRLPSLRFLKGFKETHDGPKPAHLRIGMFKVRRKFHRDLPPSTVYAYGTSKLSASVPGPVIEAISGISTYVKWENHLPQKGGHMFMVDHSLMGASLPQHGIPTVVHLHGGLNEPPSDGHSNSWFTAGFKETGPTWSKEEYHYHNAKGPGNLWYHDHAAAMTRLNILAGLFAPFILREPTLEDPLHLPSGRKYDRHLVVFDRAFTQDGNIYINSTGNNPTIHPSWQPEYFGDVIVVNGKAWPYLKVHRRKYRFRIINASNARFFNFSLDNGLPFTQIGSDAFYLDKPIVVKDILLAPSEIADVIIDFNQSSTRQVLLINDAVYPFPSGDPVNELNSKVMKFIVMKEPTTRRPTDGSHNNVIPKTLMPIVRLKPEDAVVMRNIVMFEFESEADEPTHLLLNFLPFEAAATEMPKQGTTEMWHIINLTEDNHPLHIHLAGFQVWSMKELNNTDGLRECMAAFEDVKKCKVLENAMESSTTKAPPNEQGWKNVFKMPPGVVTTILLRFSEINFDPFPFDATQEPGYVYHCHILDHEDNAMMRPLKLVL